MCTYSNLHALASNKLHAAHYVLLHLDQLGELPGELGAELASGLSAEGMAWELYQLGILEVCIYQSNS